LLVIITHSVLSDNDDGPLPTAIPLVSQAVQDDLTMVQDSRGLRQAVKKLVCLLPPKINGNSCSLQEQCQSRSASPVTFPVLILCTYYYHVDQSKECTKYMCVTAEECSCSRHV
jgi:hypothetical protein